MSLTKHSLCFFVVISGSFLFSVHLNVAGAQENPVVLKGPALIIDGDTLEVLEKRIRLHGIDAPERDQICKIGTNDWNCGIAAQEFLHQTLAGKIISCESQGTDRYGRIIGICMSLNLNINSTMVANGWAVAYRYYSNDYVPEEDSAKENRHGIWKGEFITPYNWRRGVRWPN